MKRAEKQERERERERERQLKEAELNIREPEETSPPVRTLFDCILCMCNICLYVCGIQHYSCSVCYTGGCCAQSQQA